MRVCALTCDRISSTVYLRLVTVLDQMAELVGNAEAAARERRVGVDVDLGEIPTLRRHEETVEVILQINLENLGAVVSSDLDRVDGVLVEVQ